MTLTFDLYAPKGMCQWPFRRRIFPRKIWSIAELTFWTCSPNGMDVQTDVSRRSVMRTHRRDVWRLIEIYPMIDDNNEVLLTLSHADLWRAATNRCNVVHSSIVTHCKWTAKEVMFALTFVCLFVCYFARLSKTIQPIFRKFGRKWHMGQRRND